MSQNPITKDSLVVCKVNSKGDDGDEPKEALSQPKSPLTKTPCVDQLVGFQQTTIVEYSSTPTRKRTISQSVSETMLLATGHVYDNLSKWFEESPEQGFVRP